MDALARRIERVRGEPTKQVIRDFLARCRRPYLAWSGGKDSTLMLWFARQIRPDIEVIYLDADSCLPDGWEYMQRLVAEWDINFRVVRTRPILDVLAEYGLDDPRIEERTMRATVYDPVRQLVAEGYDGGLIGIRAEESRGRRLGGAHYGSLFWARQYGMWEGWPMLWWRQADVWVYIDHHRIPYHPAYDKTAIAPREELRVSYWAGETNREYGRYVWLKRYYPELYGQLANRVPEVKNFA